MTYEIGDAVTYKDVNLWDYKGKIVQKDGAFVLVKWERSPNPVKEWAPNLRKI